MHSISATAAAGGGRISRPRVVVSWSGGKDSTITLEHLLADPRLEVACLLTAITTEYDRISIHGVRTTLLRAQCDALGQRLVTFEIPAQCSNRLYEAALGQALLRLRDEGIDAIAFGDLFLSDVRAYRERVVSHAGMNPLFPLWGRDTRELAEKFVSDGYRAVLVSVDPAQLPAVFCSRDFDESLLQDLPPGCDPCGERGEFHTFVYDGPIFTRAIAVERGLIVERGNAVFGDLA